MTFSSPAVGDPTGGSNGLFDFNQEGFDFNLEFEQVFFSIIPSVLFIVSSIWRTLSQVRKPTVVDAPGFRIVKLGAISTYICLELTLLILLLINNDNDAPTPPLLIASSVLKLVSALLMIALSLIDHAKSPRPSVLLNIYLFLTLLLDAAQARTLFLISSFSTLSSEPHRLGGLPDHTYSSVFVTSVALKIAILVIEAQRKSRWVRWGESDAEKEHSPEETSGIFSLGVFFWLNGVFWKGYSKILRVEDLYPLDCALDGGRLSEIFEGVAGGQLEETEVKGEVEKRKGVRGDKFGLVKLLTRSLKIPLLLPVLPRLALLGFVFCQPFFIEKLLEHLAQPEGVEKNVGYGFIGAAVLIYSGIAFSRALYWYFHHRTRAMARTILVTEVYRKATRIRIGAEDEKAAVTLMSTDIERIVVGFMFLHDIWASFIQVGIASWMLYQQLGVAFVAPMALVAACSVGMAVLMRFTGDSQKKWMAEVQRRVGLTSTVIASMKNLKISGLSGAVGDFVQKLRVDELQAGTRFRKIMILSAVFGFVPILFGPPLTFASSQTELSVGTMFTSLSYLLLLTDPLVTIFQTIPSILSGLACLSRIQAFLECDTRRDFRKVLSDIRRDAAASSEKRELKGEDQNVGAEAGADPIVVTDANFGWEADKSDLHDINMRVPKSSLTIVVGSVGSGKSTLCKALLGEIPYSSGSVVLSTRFPHVGFCEQTAFLSNASIRDNIVGFSPFDSERYDQIIEATALAFDFATLPQGDETNVGSDGITLSGGQKQRVSLARALYLQSDLLVLDDIFSGLDADTEEQVFRGVFGTEGLLRQRRTTVVLCTHSIRHLPAADYIVALGEGRVVEQGSFAQLMERSEGGYVHRLGLRDSSSSPDSEASSVKSNKRGSSSAELDSTPALVRKPTKGAAAKTVEAAVSPQAEAARQLGDSSVYKTYVKSMGLVVAWSSLIFGALWGFFTNFPTIWLTYWSNDASNPNPSHSFAYYAGIYALLQGCAMISLLLLGIALFILAIERAGANLHQQALTTLIRAPLRFFTSTDTGVVTNLFSQDLNLIDTELPNAVLNTLFCVFTALGQAAVMLTSSWYLVISYPFLLALLYVVQRFYLRTSRQLRLLDLEAKSPLYTHFLDTLKGLPTLRAFGFISDEIAKNVRLINTSQRPSYLLYMVQQWLNLVLDVVIMFMAAVMTALAVKLHSNSGFAGASMVTLMGFGDSLSGIVLQWTKLETSIGAIGRLNTFNETVKPEDKDREDVIPPAAWPERGEVVLKGVSASYDVERDDDGEPSFESNAKKERQQPNLVLKDINLAIKPGEKIAICGRTGSGKSSLVGFLLKLLDPLSSSYNTSSISPSSSFPEATIDDTPLDRINRQALRQQFIAVPQEAVFLPDGSTFQANLDPLALSSPFECEEVLRAVGLWEFVQSRGGLDAGMSPGTLSAGQRQLLSLGRALLRRRERSKIHSKTSTAKGKEVAEVAGEGGILILDEVSSSVDHETERVMQDITRTEFQAYTVIAVSHRLEMIMDFDRVVVMDKGVIVEVGNPLQLVAEGGKNGSGEARGSRFAELVAAANAGRA
ncbi:P-loop containing nucleoside triphosphate hydrolase protein [Naviculisporaceae sp. PSN 640]